MLIEMEKKSNQSEIQDTIKELKVGSIKLLVHALRVALKLGIITALFVSNSNSTIPLSIYLLLSEVFDQISLYLMRVKPSLEKWIQIFYVVNSVAVISTVAYFANWSLNDYYLIYLVHISSATLAYGTRIGMFSFVISSLCYSTLLYFNQAPILIYIRLPLISIIVLRLLISQKNFEKVDNFLRYVINIEKSKQDFIAIASHNLRTPVAAIYGYIEILLRGDVGHLNQDQTTYVTRIRSNNHELEQLTEQLLQISILEIGKEINLLKQSSQIEVIIQDIVEKFTALAKTKGVQLTFKKQEGMLPLVNIDVEKIKSVLINLVDNAVKYTEKGSVTATARKEDDVIVVSVKDTGIGVAREDLADLFSKFKQLKSGDRSRKGTGLGLVVSKGIVEAHVGKIWAESAGENLGSTFSFSLPLGTSNQKPA